MAALIADALVGTVLTLVGIPGLLPLPWWQTLAVFGYAMISCLVVNDALKVAMIKWRVVKAVAKKPVDLTPPIAKRAYELYEQRGRGDVRRLRTGARRSARSGKMSPLNEPTRTARRALPKE